MLTLIVLCTIFFTITMYNVLRKNNCLTLFLFGEMNNNSL